MINSYNYIQLLFDISRARAVPEFTGALVLCLQANTNTNRLTRDTRDTPFLTRITRRSRVEKLIVKLTKLVPRPSVTL